MNEPILQAINMNVLAGRNIDWIELWRSLGTKFTTVAAREKFEEYIPPYKNLGAIFIRAYRNSMEE